MPSLFLPVAPAAAAPPVASYFCYSPFLPRTARLPARKHLCSSCRGRLQSQPLLGQVGAGRGCGRLHFYHYFTFHFTGFEQLVSVLPLGKRNHLHLRPKLVFSAQVRNLTQISAIRFYQQKVESGPCKRFLKYLNTSKRVVNFRSFFSWRVALNPSGVSSKTNTQRVQSHPPGDHTVTSVHLLKPVQRVGNQANWLAKVAPVPSNCE